MDSLYTVTIFLLDKLARFIPKHWVYSSLTEWQMGHCSQTHVLTVSFIICCYNSGVINPSWQVILAFIQQKADSNHDTSTSYFIIFQTVFWHGLKKADKEAMFRVVALCDHLSYFFCLFPFIRFCISTSWKLVTFSMLSIYKYRNI